MNIVTGIHADVKTPLDVSVGPMTIDIETDTLTTNKMMEKASNTVLLTQINGFASESTARPHAYYTVLNSDSPYKDRQNVLVHEREHIKNRLFEALFDKQPEQEEADRLWVAYTQEEDAETRRALLDEFLRSRRLGGLACAKDEIIAMKKDGKSDYYDLFFDHQEGNPYDYLRQIRKHDSLNQDSLQREAVQRILVKEYREIIEQALSSFDYLRKNGFSIDETIALFTDKSLHEWPKTTKRLLEQKKSHV